MIISVRKNSISLNIPILICYMHVPSQNQSSVFNWMKCYKLFASIKCVHFCKIWKGGLKQFKGLFSYALLFHFASSLPMSTTHFHYRHLHSVI